MQSAGRLMAWALAAVTWCGTAIWISPVLAQATGRGSATPTTAQQTIDLSTIRRCTTCALTVRQVALLGASDGDGTIDTDAMRVVFGARAGVYAAFAGGCPLRGPARSVFIPRDVNITSTFVALGVSSLTRVT